MIRTILIDDEPKSRLVLRQLLDFLHAQIEIVGEASDIQDGIEVIQNLKPDLVFMDIHLLNGDSFQILEAIPNPEFEVVFVTAYDEYSVKALRYCRIPCLFKPIDLAELETVLHELNFPSDNHDRLETLFMLLRSGFNDLPLPTENSHILIPLKEVFYFHQIPGAIEVFSKSGEDRIRQRNLDDLRSTFELKNFKSLGPDYLVNVSLVDSEASRAGVLKFANGGLVALDKELLYQFLKSV